MQTAQFVEASVRNPDALDTGVLIARLVFGLSLSAHGAQKLFGWFGGHGLTASGGFFEQLGFRPGRLFAAIASVTEIVAGLLITFGLLGPVGPALMLSVMIVAAGAVHWPQGFFAATNGIELPLLYATVAIVLALTGPGLLSLDALLGLEALWAPVFASAALTIGVIGGFGNLAARRPAPSELCLPPGTDRQRVTTVHLAIPGATYSHLYWGWPYRPEKHSYAGHLLTAGYALFVFDRIGTGQSSHPPGATVTIEVNAFVVHQLVRALRSGAIGKTAFQRVVLVGHALGSIVALAYLTTPPGSREASFALASDPDPQLLALDEATKETVTTAELRTAGAVLTSVSSFAIRVPVLMVAGQFDPGVCGGASICASLEASEAAFAIAEGPFFAPDACLETVMIEDAGHYLNLEPTAPATYALIRAWSDAHVGLYRAAAPCSPGRMRSGGPWGILALGRIGTPDEEALRLGA